MKTLEVELLEEIDSLIEDGLHITKIVMPEDMKNVLVTEVVRGVPDITRLAKWKKPPVTSDSSTFHGYPIEIGDYFEIITEEPL